MLSIDPRSATELRRSSGRLPAGLLSAPELSEAAEAIARMLPSRLPEDGAYGVIARAALATALPHLIDLLTPVTEDLRMAVLALHFAHEPWDGAVAVCHHDDLVWPCPTAQLCAASEAPATRAWS